MAEVKTGTPGTTPGRTRNDERPKSARSRSRSRGRRRKGPRVNDTDRRMMERAIELARAAADLGEVPVGAVVYRGDEVIAEAHNLREQTNDPTTHAELMALSQAGRVLGEWRLSGCTLAVTLEPCPMCAGAIVNARIDRVIYGARDPKAGACDTLFAIPTDRRLNHEVDVVGGVMADECAELLKEFFQSRRDQKRAAREEAASEPDAESS